MSDAAARRRQRILQAAGNRMAVVSGLASGAAEQGEQPQAAATTEATAGDVLAVAGGGGNRARMRRLQSRNIALEGASSTATFTTTTTTTTTTVEPEPEPEPEPEKPEEALAVAESSEPQPPQEQEEQAAVPVKDEKEQSSSSTSADAAPVPPVSRDASFTTGGNTLRRRFHASKSSLGVDEDLGLGGKGAGESTEKPAAAPAHPILAAQQQRSALQRFFDAALATEAGLRFLLVLVAGLAAGVWAVAANAGVIAEGFDQHAAAAAASGSGAGSGPRAALNAFVSGSSSKGGYAYSATAGSGGVLGWVRGLFLPPTFDSWPLPVLAVALHLAAALVAPLLLRLKSSGAGSKRAAILARMPSADGTPPPPPPPVGGGGAAPEQGKSFMETMAQQMGLGPLLDIFRFAQAAWQDALLFSFAFLAALAVASASEHIFLALVSGAGAGSGGAEAPPAAAEPVQPASAGTHEF